MKTIVCFDIDKLTELLPRFELRHFDVTYASEDGCDTKRQYYFCHPDVISIHVSEGLFSDTMFIKLEDGTEITAMSSNVNVDDLSIIRINNNDFVSPVLIDHGSYVESTKELLDWLARYNITETTLTSIRTTFIMYEDIEYPGVPTPDYSFGGWSYSSKTLVLKEQEIETVLNSIEDKLLREKIKCILYARVFRRK